MWPGDFTVDPHGYLYVSCPWRSSVVAYDLQGKRVAAFGKKGSGIGELLYNNASLRISPGRIYVADTGNSRIQAFTRSGESLGVWAGPADKPLCRPLGVAIGPNETLWVTDTLNDRIVRVPLADFWQQVSKTPAAKPVIQQAQAAVPAPTPGNATIEGIVIAGRMTSPATSTSRAPTEYGRVRHASSRQHAQSRRVLPDSGNAAPGRSASDGASVEPSRRPRRRRRRWAWRTSTSVMAIGPRISNRNYRTSACWCGRGASGVGRCPEECFRRQ